MDSTDDQSLSTSDIASADERPTGAAAERWEHGTDDVTSDATDRGVPLFPPEDSERLRSTWSEIQSAFVDDPKRSVEMADALVAEALKGVAEMFSQGRASLEQQWARGEEASTEELRVILQRYRSFFDRLLAA